MTTGYSRRSINSAKKAQCSLTTSLEATTFSHQYWANQHHYLINAVRQFGFPSVFITISPFEWTFPFPPWLNNLRNETGKGPTKLAIPETIHIAHVLEIICAHINRTRIFCQSALPWVFLPPTIGRNSSLICRLTLSMPILTSLLRWINSMWSTTQSGSMMPSSLTRRGQ